MTHRRAAVALLAALLALAACDRTVDDASPTTAPSSVAGNVAPLALTGELAITRQRDLLDRGLINVMTTNDGDHDVVITSRRLVADTFEAPAARPRATTMRPGRTVALQVPYGAVVDCAGDAPVTARLRITYGTTADPSDRSADVELTGTDILDEIRAEQCTTREVAAAADVRIDDVTVDGDVVRASIVLTPTAGAPPLVVERAGGTIMFGVDTTGSDLPTEVSTSTGPVAIPVTFVVNRCDPHALAEITKRYGLDLDVAVDGRPAHPVAVDVAPVIPSLDVVLERCRAASSE